VVEFIGVKYEMRGFTGYVKNVKCVSLLFAEMLVAGKSEM
jgi:hypothetical protein